MVVSLVTCCYSARLRVEADLCTFWVGFVGDAGRRPQYEVSVGPQNDTQVAPCIVLYVVSPSRMLEDLGYWD